MGTPWGWRLFLSADPELSSVLAVDYASDAVKKTTARVGELGMMSVLASRDVGGLAALWRQVGAVLPGRMCRSVIRRTRPAVSTAKSGLIGGNAILKS